MDKSCLYITIVCVVALAFQVVAVSTNSWEMMDEGPVSACRGLWQMCSNSPSGQGCVDIPTSQNIQTVRAFAVLGAVFTALALCCMQYKPEMKKCHILLLAIGGVCSLVATSVYSQQVKVGGSSYGYSYALNLTAGILLVIVAISCAIHFYKAGHMPMSV